MHTTGKTRNRKVARGWGRREWEVTVSWEREHPFGRVTMLWSWTIVVGAGHSECTKCQQITPKSWNSSLYYRIETINSCCFYINSLVCAILLCSPNKLKHLLPSL